MDTATLITLGIAIVSSIAYVVRIESKTNTHTSDIEDLYQTLQKHLLDRNIHHDADELNRKFDDFKQDLSDIKAQVTSGFNSVTARIDKLISNE